MAQLVNVIAPIMTSDTGAWKQTIFYPFMHASAYGRGTVLNTLVKAPVYDTRQYGEVSELDSVCVWDQEHETLTIFAVNKNLEEDMEVVNTEAAPDTVAPSVSYATKLDQGRLETVLGKHSWNVIRLGK